jgi:hypothetical protein
MRQLPALAWVSKVDLTTPDTAAAMKRRQRRGSFTDQRTSISTPADTGTERPYTEERRTNEEKRRLQMDAPHGRTQARFCAILPAWHDVFLGLAMSFGRGPSFLGFRAVALGISPTAARKRTCVEWYTTLLNRESSHKQAFCCPARITYWCWCITEVRHRGASYPRVSRVGARAPRLRPRAPASRA